MNFLAQDLKPGIKYYCCPPVKMLGRVVCHLLEKEQIDCLLIVPVWHSVVFWPTLQQSERFKEAIVREIRFWPKFFMSNNAQSLLAGVRISKWRPLCLNPSAYMYSFL